jgi:DNA-binding CsgD family transcriptional regulator
MQGARGQNGRREEVGSWDSLSEAEQKEKRLAGQGLINKVLK